MCHPAYFDQTVGAVLTGLGIFFIYRHRRSKKKEQRVSVVPARPLSAWGGPPVMGNNSRQSSFINNANGNSRSMRGETLPETPTPNRTARYLQPPGGRTREGSPHSLESRIGLLSPNSRLENQQYPIQDVGRQRPVSIITNPTAAWNLPSPEQPESPTSFQNLAYPEPTRSPSDGRSNASKLDWRYPARSPTPPSPTPREEEKLFGLYPEGQHVSSNRIEPVEILADYPRAPYSYDYSPYQPTRTSIQNPPTLGRPSSFHEDNEPIAPIARRYEQERISFIPVLEGGGGDLSSKRYSFLDDETEEKRVGGRF
jgi:hypothetical protein